MQEITIRKANKDDAGIIANLSWQTFFDTYAAYNTKEDMQHFLEQHFTKATVLEELADEKITFLLAILKREIVGYAKLSEGQKPEQLGDANALEISRLYSAKNKIGSGVGRLLMQHCIEIARAKTKDFLWLGVWSENQRAIQFYRKFGFEKFGHSIFMLGNDKQDDWLMKLDLTKSLL